mgnify:CR=1 FL=1
MQRATSKYEISISGEIPVIKVNLNRATLTEVDAFSELIQNHIDQDYIRFIIDLSVCEFIDSTFLGVLITTVKKLTPRGGKLKLVGFQPAVMSMFQLTKIFRVFEAYYTVDDALKSFQLRKS